MKGEPVGFALTMPDANEAFKVANGRLTTFGLPIGLAKLLLATRQHPPAAPGTARHQGGLPAPRPGRHPLPGHAAARRSELGYEGGEISWTLEDNHLVNRAIESMGGKRSKTYRVYERPRA